jgi:hypothetical protein
VNDDSAPVHARPAQAGAVASLACAAGDDPVAAITEQLGA